MSNLGSMGDGPPVTVLPYLKLIPQNDSVFVLLSILRLCSFQIFHFPYLKILNTIFTTSLIIKITIINNQLSTYFISNLGVVFIKQHICFRCNNVTTFILVREIPENKSRVLPHLLLCRNVRLSLMYTCILAIHSCFIGCLPLEKSY
jgi:hypothetical protein